MAAETAHSPVPKRIGNVSGWTGPITNAPAVVAGSRPGHPGPSGTLLLHSRDDDEVPFACGEAMAARVPGVRLEAFDGLGHRAILYAPPPVRAAAGFLDGAMEGP